MNLDVTHVYFFPKLTELVFWGWSKLCELVLVDFNIFFQDYTSINFYFIYCTTVSTLYIYNIIVFYCIILHLPIRTLSPF